MTVTGSFGEIGHAEHHRRNAGKALLAENCRAFAPGHDAVGRAGIGGGAGENVGGVVFGHAAVNIGPAAGRTQRHRTTLRARGKTFHRNDLHGLRRTRCDKRRMQLCAGTRRARGHGFSGFAGDADMQRNAHSLVPYFHTKGQDRRRRDRTNGWRIQPAAEHPVRPFILSAGRSPGLRISGFPQRSLHLPQLIASGLE